MSPGRIHALRSWVLASLASISTTLFASENLAVPEDGNSWVVVENAITGRKETTVFFLTRPDIGDPGARDPCPLNYYSVKLSPGLPAANPEIVAKGVCGGSFQKSRLLDNGDALIMIRDRLERWRSGEKISSVNFSSLDATGKLGVSTDMAGGQFYDIAPNGNIVLAVVSGSNAQDRGEYAGSSLVVTGMMPGGKKRWEVRFADSGQYDTIEQVRAGADGSALLYRTSLASPLGSAEGQLHFIRPDGSKKLIRLNETGAPPDMDSLTNMSQEDLQRFMQSQGQSDPESIERLDALAREGGGFDVLFQRKGGGARREGFFLYRLGVNGKLQSEIALGNHIETHGLDRWFDFRVEDDQLVLLSKAPVTQKVVRGVKRKWGQIIVSWIALDSGVPRPYLIPLDDRYLEAAMNAGDAGQKDLEGQPGSEPVLLATLGGEPLVVSVGWVSNRQVVRLHVADEQLTAFTEVVDERRSRQAKEDAREQRRTDREARKARMRANTAAAAGMSEEEYFALSKEEQKEALMRNGGADILMESMTREAQSAREEMERQGQPGATPSTPQQYGDSSDMQAQIAAAMAEAQRQMEADPNMTPEMRAQMAAIMAQAGQGMGEQAAPSQALVVSNPEPESVLKVDARKRVLIEFENLDRRLMTLLIFDRETGRELLKKDYPDGLIREQVDFSQFKLPLKQIGVLYRETGGMILADLTPVIAQ